MNSQFKQGAIEWGKAILIALAIYFVFNLFFGIKTVVGDSMYSTLQDGNRLLLTKVTDINKGDIVSFKSDLTLTQRDIDGLNPIQKLIFKPGDRKALIKRVIAEEGDTIAMYEGTVILNGKALDEPYVYSTIGTTFEPVVVPEGTVFVMGDNRANSHDSRASDVGFVELSDIEGKVWLRILPVSKFGKVD